MNSTANDKREKGSGRVRRVAVHVIPPLIATLASILGTMWWQSSKQEADSWREADRRVNLLVRTVIRLDSIEPSEQPRFGDPHWQRLAFVRESQTSRHPSAWRYLEKQIPLVSDTSESDDVILAASGHEAVGALAHGDESFAKARFQLWTRTVLEETGGTKLDVPLSLLAYARTADYSTFIPTRDTDARMAVRLVSEKTAQVLEGVPHIDLSDPRVRETLQEDSFSLQNLSESVTQVGFSLQNPPEFVAVPELTNIDSSDYRVELPMHRGLRAMPKESIE